MPLIIIGIRREMQNELFSEKLSFNHWICFIPSMIMKSLLVAAVFALLAGAALAQNIVDGELDVKSQSCGSFEFLKSYLKGQNFKGRQGQSAVGLQVNEPQIESNEIFLCFAFLVNRCISYLDVTAYS